MKILAMFFKKILKKIFKKHKNARLRSVFSRVCIGFFFLGWVADFPAVAFVTAGGKILSVACPFPVKNVTDSISRFYQFCITIALRLSAKKDILRKRGKRKTPPYGSPAAAKIKGLGERKSSRNCPGCPCVFCQLFQKRLSSSVCSIISSTLQCRMLHSLSMVLVCTFLFFRNLSSWERFTLWYV